MNLSDTVRKLAKDIAELTKLVMNIRATTGGGVTTGQNIGVGGVGVYHSVAASTMRFRTVNAASAQIAVSLDAVNNEVDIDVGPHMHQAAGSGGQLDHGLALTGLGDVADHPGYVTLDGLRPLTGNWDVGAAAGRMIQAGYLVAGGAVAAKEVLQTEDAFALKETSEPGTDAGYGKIWVSSADGLPYFKDDAGVICGLCGGGGSGGGDGGFPYFRLGTTRRIMYAPVHNSVLVPVGVAITHSGTRNNNNDDNTAFLRMWVSGTAYIRSSFFTEARKAHNPSFYSKFKTGSAADLTSMRTFIGVHETPGLNPLNDDPGGMEYALISLLPTNANFYFISKDNAGNQEATDSGLVMSPDTTYDFRIDLFAGGNVTFYLWETYGSGYAEVTHTNYFPDNSTDLGMDVTVSRTAPSGTWYFNLSYMTIEAD